MPLWRYLESGGKRAVAIWHRRAGKDDLCLHWTACAAHERVGTYWHMLPEAEQARKAIWAAINPHTGVRRIDEAFPPALRASTRDNDMMIRFKNGSTWQVVGSDNFNSLIGSPPVGIVFSEWAVAHPASWAYLRPILRENGGWALFITTPRGRNHAWQMFDGARADPTWFVEKLTAEQTGVFSAEALKEELDGYTRDYGADTGEALYRQEYLCSFDSAVIGSYYGAEIERAETQGRIRAFPVDETLPVHTAWDLGYSDSTAIWFFQIAGKELRFVDYYEAHGKALPHYVAVLMDRGYNYGDDWLPHDAKVHSLETGRTRVETLQALGRKNLRLVPKHKVEDGINGARVSLTDCWFALDRCADGVEKLRQYRREYDEKTRAFNDSPKHDFTSHCADAFRYACMAWREVVPRVKKPDPRNPKPLATTPYDILFPLRGVTRHKEARP